MSELAASGPDERSAEELTTAAAKGLRWFAMSRFGTEVLLMFAMVVLARLVSPAEFGAFAIALIVFQIATSVPAEGIGSALVQRREATTEHLEAGVALALILMTSAALLTLLLSYVVVAPLCGDEAAWLVRLSCPLFVLQAVATVPMAILRRRLDFRRLSIIELSSSAARSSVSLGLVVIAGMGASGMVFGVIAGGVCTAAMALASARTPLPRLRLAAARDLAGYGVPASAAAVAWTGFANGDYAVLAARLGTAAAGMYWRAYSLGIDYQRKASVVMNTLAFPVLARSRDDVDFSALRRRMVRLLTVVLFPLLTGLAITAPYVVPGVFGPAWGEAVVPTQLLAAGGAACLVIDAVGSAMMAAGRARGLLGYGVAHFVVYIGSVVLIAPLGINAVALDAAIVHGLFMVAAYAMLVTRSDERALPAFGVMSRLRWSVPRVGRTCRARRPPNRHGERRLAAALYSRRRCRICRVPSYATGVFLRLMVRSRGARASPDSTRSRPTRLSTQVSPDAVRGVGEWCDHERKKPTRQPALQRPRIVKYRALSNCSNVSGSAKRLQPLLLLGQGAIVIGRDVTFGYPSSIAFYSGYCHLEAVTGDSAIEIGDGAEINNNAYLKSEGPGISTRCRRAARIQRDDPRQRFSRAPPGSAPRWSPGYGCSRARRERLRR